MAIEKMIMLDIIGQRIDLEKITKAIVFSDCMHIVKAAKEIAATKKLDIAEEKLFQHIREEINLIDMNELSRRIDNLKSINISNTVHYLNENDIISSKTGLLKAVKELEIKLLCFNEELNRKYTQLEEINGEVQKINYLENLSPYINSLMELHNFKFKIYKCTAGVEYADSFNGIVFNIDKTKKYEILLVIIPNNSKEEFKDYIVGVNTEEIEIPVHYKNNIIFYKRKLVKEGKEVSDSISSIKKQFKALCDKNSKQMSVIEESLKFQLEVIRLNNSIAGTSEFFYLSGWVPEGRIGELKDSVKELEDRIIVVEKRTDALNSEIVPPTKLRNRWLVKPFEKMVNLYGVPSYKEADPTTFLAISYMIMFGAMFGDLGQGIVLFLAGLYLMKKKKNSRPNLGGVLSRLGTSSSIFGILYGSFFGFENVIPALFLRPMENISETLAFAVVLGCIFLITGFVYSLINNKAKHNVEDGIFGKNGAAGMFLYIFVLCFILIEFCIGYKISAGILFSVVVFLLAMILFKQPAANILTGKRPLYKTDAADYYIEEGFGLVETILGMVSNTISFVRVGAFALNHVGLFMAFSVLAQMTHSNVGGFIMYFLGNAVILTLECLIVFIQGLRLEYYELFGKYYDGSGIPFEPAGVKIKNKE